MSKRILIIEDHDSLRQLIGVFLSKKFEVVGARNGLEAMGRLSQGLMPDVIVTDVRMPELNGAQFLGYLRSSGLYGDIPVVVISGTTDGDEEQRLRQMGVTDFISKPFSPLVLQERLQQIILSTAASSAMA